MSFASINNTSLLKEGAGLMAVWSYTSGQFRFCSDDLTILIEADAPAVFPPDYRPDLSALLPGCSPFILWEWATYKITIDGAPADPICWFGDRAIRSKGRGLYLFRYETAVGASVIRVDGLPVPPLPIEVLTRKLGIGGGTVMNATDLLDTAIRSYNYPAVTYDFHRQEERVHASMRPVEDEILASLMSPDLKRLKDGLANILYWGFFRSPGRRNYRVKEFREKATDNQLDKASFLFRRLSGPGLLQLKAVGLPGFSNMSFVSKLRTFLDPERYAVLDQKILRLLVSEGMPQSLHVKMTGTSFGITPESERAYERWCAVCRRLALGRAATRAVDVERGLFHLVETAQLAAAVSLVIGAARQSEP